MNEIVLGIETSCDETAAAIVSSEGEILANIVLSQLDSHEIYGGVVPEIAAREHLIHIDRLILRAMQESGIQFPDLSAVAATSGPGLIGGVMVGMMTGKGIAASCGLPFYAINHLEAHALSPRITERLDFPYLLLLASGGHTALVHVQGVGRYTTLGTTLDDALGELFDKAGKMMGLPYPGGPHVEKMARQATLPGRQEKTSDLRARWFDLPRPLLGRQGCDFSFSGLKTAVRLALDKLPPGDLDPADAALLCQSLHEAVCDVLSDRCKHAFRHIIQIYGSALPLVVAGGVAANTYIRQTLARTATEFGQPLIAPPLELCTDNGAMIAWAGLERLHHSGPKYELDARARPRWLLDETKA